MGFFYFFIHYRVSSPFVSSFRPHRFVVANSDFMILSDT
jgi:hypothetical protein